MSKTKKIVFILLIPISLATLFGCNNAQTNTNQTNMNQPTAKNTNLAKPSMILDTTKAYSAIIKTSQGDMEIKLFSQDTPITVNNFVYLAKEKFYDNTIFHRAIKNFMIQGGDPKGDGTGGPGYRFDDETFKGEYKRGIVAMANAGPDTNGSQFFIMHEDFSLSPDYVIFGEVTQGLDVLDKIATAPVKPNAQGEMSVPIEPVKVQTIEIIEK